MRWFDIPVHNQFIPAEHLKSQEYIRKIREWTANKKMVLNEKKTKVMIFNFTDKHKFTTRLQLNNENLEVVNQTKLLGVIITEKAYSRMELLTKVADRKEIYVLYIRSVLEQSSVV